MNQWTKFLLLFGLTTVCCFAQQSPFGRAAQGFAVELAGTARWFAIIMCIFCAISIMAGGTHMVLKIGGLVIGMVFALFASPIVNYVASL